IADRVPRAPRVRRSDRRRQRAEGSGSVSRAGRIVAVKVVDRVQRTPEAGREAVQPSCGQPSRPCGRTRPAALRCAGARAALVAAAVSAPALAFAQSPPPQPTPAPGLPLEKPQTSPLSG